MHAAKQNSFVRRQMSERESKQGSARDGGRVSKFEFAVRGWGYAFTGTRCNEDMCGRQDRSRGGPKGRCLSVIEVNYGSENRVSCMVSFAHTHVVSV